MKNTNPLYHGYRFSPEIISHSVWLYHRFCLSFRDVEDLLAERGVIVSYETIRHWCREIGSTYARTIKKRRGTLGDTWYLDEVYIVTVRGERRYLWRAVDQESLPHERQMRRFKSPGQAQRFRSVNSQVQNLFRVGRHLLRATNYRKLRNRSFETWQQVTCAC